ncbi:MAG: sensor histidine kinase, partial [Planctomycetota bacterium]
MTSDPQPPTCGELDIPLLAPTGRDMEVAASQIRRAGLECVRCQTVAHLLQCISAGCGPAVIAAEALRAEDTAAIDATLSAQPNWSDLPLMLFSGRGEPSRYLAPLITRRSTTVLRRPIQVRTFLGVVRAAVEARRRQYEMRDLLRDLRQLNDQLKLRAGQLQRLALEVTEAEDRERRRLAELLHDDLQQLLVGAKFHLGTLPGRAMDPQSLRQAVADLQDLLDQAIARSRRLSHDLSPPVLQQAGLLPALENLSGQMAERHGLHMEIHAGPEAEPDSEPVRFFLYRAIQELLFNVVKHARTDRADVYLRRGGEETVAIVQDYGCGFVPERLHA